MFVSVCIGLTNAYIQIQQNKLLHHILDKVNPFTFVAGVITSTSCSFMQFILPQILIDLAVSNWIPGTPIEIWTY